MVTYTFTDGTLIKSSEMNTNFTDLQDDVDINISDISDNADDIATNATNLAKNNSASVSVAQNYFETLKHSGDVDNEDYLIADIFTSDIGAKSTINTGASSAEYKDDDDVYIGHANFPVTTGTETAGETYYGDTTGVAANVFDGNSSTYWRVYSTSSSTNIQQSFYVQKVFTSKYVNYVRVKYNMAPATEEAYCYLQKYDGSTWTTIENLGRGNIDQICIIDDNIQGYRLLGSNREDDYPSTYVYMISEVSFSTGDVETNNLIALDGTEKGIVVYDKSNKPTGTSIKVDVVGSSTISNQNVREYIDISSFTGGNLSLDFNLSTTDTSVTPSLYGYGIAIIK